ncbi:unnamed protein product [Somion occarium]|uniref:ARM repeat-containing protein n=1 Tax=Somion occarium TaxID=3059160 RepID=A0ABP1DD45_9APHY
MGIILSILFPRFMFTERSSTSAPSSPSSSTRSLSPQPFHDAHADISPSPSPTPFYTPSNSPPPPPENPHNTSPQIRNTILESPPLDSHPFVPHAVGLGIASPRPMFSPLSAFHREHSAQTHPTGSPIHTRMNPFDSPSFHASSSGSSGLLSPFNYEHCDSPLPSPPITSGRQPPNVAFSSEQIDLAYQSHTATHQGSSGVSSHVGLPEPISVSSPHSYTQSHQPTASSSSVRLSPPLFESIDGVAYQEAVGKSYPTTTDVSSPSGTLSLDLEGSPHGVRPNPLAGPSSSLTPSNSLAVNPLDDEHSPNGLASAAGDSPQFDPTEFDAEGLSTLEKIYLFSRSKLGFHRVYIANALAGFLRAGTNDDGTPSHTGDDQEHAPVDSISPEEAVEYVLPLLNGLAMDEDEAVKEALSAELVPIIWWFITRCKLVEDDGIPAIDLDAEQVLQGADYPHQAYHIEESPPHPPPSSHSDAPRDPAVHHEPSFPAIVRPIPLRPGENLRPPTPRPPTPRPCTPRPPTPIPSASMPPTPVLPTQISVQSFTPILGTLLLSTNARVGGPARYAVVELLKRVRQADQADAEARRSRSASPIQTQRSASPTKSSHSGTSNNGSRRSVSKSEEQDDDDEHRYSPVGLFGDEERRIFEREMVQQVVIGMGRLDIPDDNNAVVGDVSTDTEIATPGVASTSSLPTPLQSHTAETPHAASSADSYFPPIPPSTEPDISASFSASSSETRSRSDFSFQSNASIASPTPTSPMAFYDVYSTPGPLSPPLEFPPPAPSPASPPHTDIPISPSFSPLSAASSSTPSLTSGSSSVSSVDVSTTDLSPHTPPPPPPSGSSGSQGGSDVNGRNVGVVETANTQLPWVPPRSPGDLPPISDEERREWERQYASANFTFLSSDASPSAQLASGSTSGVSSWGVDIRSVVREGAEGSSQEENDLSEEAAVGRLSSMSLMAAVTASGFLAEDTKAAFVNEVERVGRDAVYWVRREASFAVGALAKVVPVAVVRTKLLPLFKSLCHDPTWHVRHSSLFALPNILSRLEPPEKRQLALDIILPLSKDENATVRSGVMEALAEVMFTFHEDEGGPPTELLELFLGIPEGQTERLPLEQLTHQPQPGAPMNWSEFVASVTGTAPTPDARNTDIYHDPTRPLVCAFNFPAVALTLGRERWHELRSLYLELSLNSSLKVRKTLAASLGELAKIIGPKQAKQDLMGVWWGSVRAEEGEVRLKAIECLDVFAENIAEEDRRDIVGGLVSEVWDLKLRGWRERESAMKLLAPFVSMGGIQDDVLLKFLMKGLEDLVAAVREAAVSSIPTFISEWSSRPQSLDELFRTIRPLATASSYRKRMIYVACQQEIIVSVNYHILVETPEFWETMRMLANDSIVDVRIRVARLLGLLSDKVLGPLDNVEEKLSDLAETLSRDVSHEVQAFAQPILQGLHPIFVPRKDPGRVIKSSSNFSRPPPPAI